VETIVKKAQIGRWLSQERGAQIADFAAVLPMLVMMIFGILWFGRAFNIYTTVNHATRAAAEAAALHNCATCGNTPSDTGTIENQIVDPIFAAAHLDPSLKGNYGIDRSTVTLPSGIQVNLYTAHMRYPYNFKLNGLTCCPPALTPITLGVTIRAQARAQEEN
jgi:Flp pilus assembly protein TadG